MARSGPWIRLESCSKIASVHSRQRRWTPGNRGPVFSRRGSTACGNLRLHMRVHHWLYTEITADQLSIQLSAVISACSCPFFTAAVPHYLLSVIYSFTRRFSVHFICTTMSISLSFSSRSLWFSSSRAFLQRLSMLIVFVPLTPRQQPPFPASTSFFLNI